MDGSDVIDSLDSLWFFSNIFSSTPQNLVSVVGDGEKGTAHLNLKESFQSKPISIHVIGDTNYSPNADIQVQKCSKCHEFSETEQQKVKTEHIKVPEKTPLKSPEKEEIRRRKGRIKRGGRVLRELDLSEVMIGHGGGGGGGGADNMSFNDENCNRGFGSWNWMVEEETCGSLKLGMPPLNDGMAMKEHLKSWAYAVACTVR